MKNNIIILLTLISTLLVASTSCSRSEELSPQAEVPVRLLTSIELGGLPQSHTRATGDVQEIENNISESFEDGNFDESKLITIRLIAFDQNSEEVTANVLFHHPNTKSLKAGEKKYKFSNHSGAASKIQLDLKLLVGSYEFLLIANEQSTWNLESINIGNSKSNFIKLSSLKAQVNKLISEVDISTTGIPMIGAGKFEIPFVKSATETNPYLAPPLINLKRTVAKMEINISNAESTTGTTVFETAKVLRLKSLTIRNINQKYNVLEEDMTPVKEELNRGTKNIGHTTGSLFNRTIFSEYMAERKGVQESNAVALDIVVEKKGEGDVTYSILLYQKKKNGTIDYNVYRNTVYRFNFVLKGNEVLALNLNVDDWTLEKSEIKFDTELIMSSYPFWSVLSEHTYTDPGYGNTIPTLRTPYQFGHYDVAEFTFKIKEPSNAIWGATLTNGLEFAFEPGSVQMGKAGIEYKIRIVALKWPSNIVRKTEFYLTINGKEQDPDNFSYGTNIIEGYMSVGPGKRYVIQQAAR